jgi:uncharacterized protein
MPEFTSYEQGTPCWAQLSTDDIDATFAFYGSLFGWEPEDTGPEMGHYHVARLRGKRVCGVSPLMSKDEPRVWLTYFSVDNADKTTERASSAGATVLAPPMDVASLGRMAVFLDPAIAAFGIWQPYDMAGADLVNEPGALIWSELDTRDLTTSQAFYSDVLGWKIVGGSGSGGPEYYELKVSDRTVAGMMPMPAQAPAGMPNAWLTYFAVANCDDGTKQVRDLGGQVLVEPNTIPAGRFSVVTGPMGEPFGLLQG